jgi:large subunit ribosomal protein L25
MGDNKKLQLALDSREVRGKKVAALRKQDIIPGVVYGADMDPITVQVGRVLFEKTYTKAGKHAPVHLTIEGTKKIAMIKEVTMDPVKHRINHFGLHAVKMSDPVTAEVPIRLIGEGESEAERSGLVILQALDKIEVKALPMDLPEAVEVSVLKLKEPGERVTLADATLPSGVEFVEHDDGHAEIEGEEKPKVSDQMVASVWEPSAIAAANEAAAGDAEEADAENVEAENGNDTSQGANEQTESSGDKDVKE